jgi:hypothetical protein
MILLSSHKDQTQGKVQVTTPLLHEVPSGRSTELTLQGPMSHWQVSAVTLASKLKWFYDIFQSSIRKEERAGICIEELKKWDVILSDSPTIIAATLPPPIGAMSIL